MFHAPLRELEQDTRLVRRRTSRGGFAEEETEARLWIPPGFENRALRQGASGFDVGGVVEQHERLQRGVGDQAA